MGKQWKDMDKVERRIVVVIAIIVIAVLINVFILPRLLRLRSN